MDSVLASLAIVSLNYVSGLELKSGNRIHEITADIPRTRHSEAIDFLDSSSALSLDADSMPNRRLRMKANQSMGQGGRSLTDANGRIVSSLSIH
jgi:hypothetical protein